MERKGIMDKKITAIVVVIFLLGISTGTVLQKYDVMKFSESSKNFSISVDFAEGYNQYFMIEVDEGDNNEEKEVTEIYHEFFFTAKDSEGQVTWDFGDGFTSIGELVSHSFTKPGNYQVSATEFSEGKASTKTLNVVVNLVSSVEVDNMECECAPTAKDSIIELTNHVGKSSLEGFVKVEHDGSSESCSLRNPLQECHVRVILQTLSEGSVIAEDVLFDDNFRTNEKVIDFNFENISLEDGELLQLRLETDQLRDWHKPTSEWYTTV